MPTTRVVATLIVLAVWPSLCALAQRGPDRAMAEVEKELAKKESLADSVKAAVSKLRRPRTPAKKQPSKKEMDRRELMSAVPGDPAIRPGHVLSITVLVAGEKDIEEEAKRVSTTGQVSLPLVGTVDVDGKTPGELAVELRALYKEYMRDPLVDVAFVVDESPGAVSPWGSVTVLGCVRQPGRINIPPTQDLTLSMAIQLAGGLDEAAKDTAIKVTRKLASGGLASQGVNLRSAASAGEIENNILLKSDDIIFVPEKVF